MGQSGRGTPPPRTPGDVAQLQQMLRQLQVLPPHEPAEPGLFDDATRTAVTRFQWFASRVGGALDLASGAFVARPLLRLPANGRPGPRTRSLMQQFIARGWAATGLLVQLDFRRLRRTHANAGFSALIDGDTGIGLCEREFAGVMAGMDAAAERLGLHVFVNQLLRVEGDAALPAPAQPASYSSHKIGRAVDLQLGHAATLRSGSNPEPPLALMNAAPRTPQGRFRRHARHALKCRYGGDFDPADPPHFDRQLLPAGAQPWTMHYFFNQLQYRQALRNPDAIATLA